MSNPAMIPRPLVCLLALLTSGCAGTKAVRHEDQSVSVAKRGTLFHRTEPTSYWLIGTKPGQVLRADDVTVYRKVKGAKAIPLNCAGFVDTTRPSRIEVRLAEKRGSAAWEQASVNGVHKLHDENAPRPFYHWLIP